jgi:hypothetical protein
MNKVLIDTEIVTKIKKKLDEKYPSGHPIWNGGTVTLDGVAIPFKVIALYSQWKREISNEVD